MKTHGIPASITLAQGCLESGDGLSDLAVEANNHFGIKCHKDWTGPTYYKKDDDPGKSCFRKYGKAEDSYKDHSDFLRYRDRYAFLFDLDVKDYKGWAYGLKKAGYATNPNYPQLLIKIIEDYKLYQYDSGRSGKSSRRAVVEVRTEIAEDIVPPSPSQLEAVKTFVPTRKSIWYKHSQNRTLYVRNGVTYIVANEGDTYENIAKEYNLFKSEILAYNDLKEDKQIIQGTIVYLERKKKQALKYLDIHIAEEGDNLYDLSQRYAVRLGKLMEFNCKKSVNDLSKDEVVYLRKRKK
jgi:LysM repeat protein